MSDDNSARNDRNHDKKTRVTAKRPKGDYVRIIPLGGLDEVGMNCCLIECNDSMLMLDCGITFPDLEGFGVDIILPDWSYVLDNLDILDGIVLTHGHEDHLGALPFFLKEVDVPVYGGRFTLGILERKLEEYDLKGMVELVPVNPGDVIEFEQMEAEFIHMNHSVPNAMSVALSTPLGRVLFTGDWKIDQTTRFEPVADLPRLAALGTEGVLALVGDSTNSSTPGFTTSEVIVQRGLHDVIEQAPGRVLVTMFSSNVYRVAGLLESAVRTGRNKVCLSGRSLRNNIGTARELDFLKLPEGVEFIREEEIKRYPDDQVLILSTGSQGEPRSALVRMARGEHARINIKEGDTVIFSARRIPGNDYGINNLINTLSRHGARVVDQTMGVPIHGSGHAQREELKMMLNLTRPKHLVPVHGEYRMRAEHGDLGRSVGVENVHLIENGDVLEFTEKGARVVDHIHTGRVLVDGSRTGDISDVQLRDRRKMAYGGVIVAFAVVDRDTGEISAGPDLLDRGFLNESETQLLERASQSSRSALEELSAEARRNPAEVRDTMRQAIRRYFRREVDRKPAVIPIVHQL